MNSCTTQRTGHIAAWSDEILASASFRSGFKTKIHASKLPMPWPKWHKLIKPQCRAVGSGAFGAASLFP